MRTQYKNQIYDVLKSTKYGLDKFDFQPAQGSWNVPDRIVFKPEPKFAFYIRCGEFDNNVFEYAYNGYAPEFPFVGYQRRSLNLSMVLIGLRDWIGLHVENYVIDQETPDLWEDYRKIGQIGFLLRVDYGKETYFTPGEQQQFQMAIGMLEKRMIAELGLTKDQIKQVKDGMDYIKGKMAGADKLAMRIFFIGTIINLIMVLTLDTERGNKLFEIIRDIFSSLTLLPVH